MLAINGRRGIYRCRGGAKHHLWPQAEAASTTQQLAASRGIRICIASAQTYHLESGTAGEAALTLGGVEIVAYRSVINRPSVIGTGGWRRHQAHH